MPDKVRNKRKLEKQKAAQKHASGHDTGGMGGEYPEHDQHNRGGMGGEYPEGYAEER